MKNKNKIDVIAEGKKVFENEIDELKKQSWRKFWKTCEYDF